MTSIYSNTNQMDVLQFYSLLVGHNKKKPICGKIRTNKEVHPSDSK